MSSELLLNIDNSSQSKAASAGKNSSTKTDKKEGFSLFDSLVNEAKNEPNEKPIDKENKNTKEKQISSSLDDKQNTQTVEKSKDSSVSIVDKKNSNPPLNSKIDHNKIVSPKEEVLPDKSLQGMVNKLVDIIVSSAKELFDKNDIKHSTQTQAVKEKINQLLGNNISDNSELKGLKVEVDKILKTTDMSKIQKEFVSTEITKVITSEISDDLNVDNIKASLTSKLNTIKQSVQNIKEETHDVKKTLSKESSNTINKLEDSKVKIVQETEVIKKETKDISDIINQKETKDVSDIINKNEDIKEIKNSNEENVIEKHVVKSLAVDSSITEIVVSTDDIKNTLEKIKPSNTNITQKKENEESFQKIDLKLEQISDKVKIIEEEVSKKIIVKTSYTVDDELAMESRVENDKSISNMLVDGKSEKETKNPLLASMFLHAQKVNKEKTSLVQVKDAKENITAKQTIDAVKESAVKLDLGLDETEVTSEGSESKKIVQEIKKDDQKVNTILDNKNLNKIVINQRVETTAMKSDFIQKEVLETVEKDKKIVESVELQVSKDTVQVLQNKIIGAQQKMGSFMSEVARNMYLNYKPPVTAFRVNLNPANLGSISIIMRANKVDNSLSVSMNLSNSNTMEAFTENKVLLQNAIQRQFNDGSNVSINFGMQDQNSENSFNNQFNQNNNNQNSNSNDSENILEENSEEQEIVENNDYM